MTEILKAFYIDTHACNVFRNRTWYLLVDEYPNYRYEMRRVEDHEIPPYQQSRTKFLYWSMAGPFLSSYVHAPGSVDAFGGATVNVPMADGSAKTFKGDLWSSGQRLVNDNIINVGVGTPERLAKCYVFSGGNYIDTDFFGSWLDQNPDKIAPYATGALA